MLRKTQFIYHVAVDGSDVNRRIWCVNNTGNYTDWKNKGLMKVKRDTEVFKSDSDEICIYSFKSKEIATEFLITWNGVWSDDYGLKR